MAEGKGESRLNLEDTAERVRRVQDALAAARREHAATIRTMSATDADEFLVVVAAERISAGLRADAKAGNAQAARISKAIAAEQITQILEDEERRLGRPIRDVDEARAVLAANLRDEGRAS